jgi:hypothetical protein
VIIGRRDEEGRKTGENIEKQEKNCEFCDENEDDYDDV